ncbi:ATP-grasp domain-containing protein [Granulicella sp. dw_53]|uniref:ATP-grasp domain-containing protein n=1 Tax=Granulicella sp. dw_53 TaxID=2719792 RepID=UPI001BD476CE|nr:ATP-grasp domain-containing protein [Granulicella sp. dw_53]
MSTSFAVEAEHIDPSSARAPIAFLYEHPQWFAPIFAELERRNVKFQRLFAPDHFYSVDGSSLPPFKVLFNRMSPSADSRDHGSGVFHTLSWLGHLELQGVRVLNGAKAFQYEISKALQHSLLQSLGLRYPSSRVIHQASQAIDAAEGLRYPIVIKPNVGGSGKGIQRFDTPEQLSRAVIQDAIEFGLDHVALVQEFIPARGGFISRVETIGGKYLYGIQVHLTGQTFDLCPADICQTARGEALDNACVLEASKAGLRVEGFTPSAEVIRAIELIVQSAGIDVGGVEYIVDDRDGEIYFYDVNALSNFVADPLRVIGFNPFERLADFLEREVANAV